MSAQLISERQFVDNPPSVSKRESVEEANLRRAQST